MLGREVFMSVGPRQAWIKAPDSGVAMPVKNWGALNQLVNGAVGGTVSRYGAKTYSLSWSFLKADEYRKIAGLFSEAGNDKVFYLDPFAKDNVLSKLAGHPYLLAESYSKLAYDDAGTALAVQADIGSEPYKGLRITDTSGGVYSEYLTVPSGYAVTLAKSGDNLVRYRWGGTGNYTTLSTAITVVPGANSVLEVAVGGAAGTLNWARAVIHKIGSAPADISNYVAPMGGGNLMVVPGSFQTTGINAAHGEYSASVELQEVWAWQ